MFTSLITLYVIRKNSKNVFTIKNKYTQLKTFRNFYNLQTKGDINEFSQQSKFNLGI